MLERASSPRSSCAAMVNLCRDEITVTLKHKIDQVFGSSFNTNGLGGVLTCGVSGVAAGLSHAPISMSTGRERYVFFSFPHISVDARARQGVISRPGRPGDSCACGALAAALEQIQREGLAANCKVPGGVRMEGRGEGGREGGERGRTVHGGARRGFRCRA